MVCGILCSPHTTRTPLPVRCVACCEGYTTVRTRVYGWCATHTSSCDKRQDGHHLSLSILLRPLSWSPPLPWHHFSPWKPFQAPKFQIFIKLSSHFLGIVSSWPLWSFDLPLPPICFANFSLLIFVHFCEVSSSFSSLCVSWFGWASTPCWCLVLWWRVGKLWSHHLSCMKFIWSLAYTLLGFSFKLLDPLSSHG